jgi:hypothetical protein
MFVRLRRAETQQNFNIWVYGDKELYRGSGLFVPETGLASNHHFLLPLDSNNFRFALGKYTLDVFVNEVGVQSARLLFITALEITADILKGFEKPGNSLYFDWGPDCRAYFAHVERATSIELKPATFFAYAKPSGSLAGGKSGGRDAGMRQILTAFGEERHAQGRGCR